MLLSLPRIQDVKWKSPWYINPLMSRTTVSPSCTNFKVLLSLIFIELISKTNTFGADLKLIGCLSACEQSGHCSCVSCSKDHNHWEVDFGVSSFSCNTKSSLSFMLSSEYLQLVHSGLEIAMEQEWLMSMLQHLCLWCYNEIVQDFVNTAHAW